MLQAGITMYRHFIILLPGVTVVKSDSFMTKETGPSGPLYDAGSYPLKTRNKSAESRTVRVITKKFD